MARVVLFGATGYTGRLTAEAMAGPAGARPVLAGRDRARPGGAGRAARGPAGGRAPTRPGRTASATSSARATCWSARSARSSPGASRRSGRPSTPAATYLDATGEPPFLRRVFEEHGPRAAGRSALIPAFGYDFVPGNLAGALALAAAGEASALPEAGPPPGPGAGRVARVSVGYFRSRPAADGHQTPTGRSPVGQSRPRWRLLARTDLFRARMWWRRLAAASGSARRSAQASSRWSFSQAANRSAGRRSSSSASATAQPGSPS